jgi:hypothetical protein
MALLLLQDCLIDLSNIDNSITISLNETLVNKIIYNGHFDEDDSSELLQTINDFTYNNNYQTNTIYLSSVFFNIPFFEEKLTESSKLELKSIYDYVRNVNATEIELLEIGKYFLCKTVYDYETNKLASFNIEDFNIDNEIFTLIPNCINYSFSDIKTINKLNQELDQDTYTEINDLEFILLKSIFSDLTMDINVMSFYEKLKDYFEKIVNNQTLIVTQLSLLYLFQVENIIKLEEKNIEITSKKNKNNFSIELLPSELTFDNDIEFNLWTDNDKSNIIIKNNEMSGEFKIESKEKDKNIINFSELNFNKILFKADCLNNLSCKITDLKNNSIVTTKINFN